MNTKKSISGFMDNLVSEPARIGKSQADLLLTLGMALFGNQAPDWMKKNLAHARIPSSQVEARLSLGQTARQMPSALLDIVKHPIDYAYQNPMSTAMSVIAPMASPQLSTAKVNLVNSIKNPSAQIPGLKLPSPELQSYQRAQQTGDYTKARQLTDQIRTRETIAPPSLEPVEIDPTKGVAELMREKRTIAQALVQMERVSKSTFPSVEKSIATKFLPQMSRDGWALIRGMNQRISQMGIDPATGMSLSRIKR